MVQDKFLDRVERNQQRLTMPQLRLPNPLLPLELTRRFGRDGCGHSNREGNAQARHVKLHGEPISKNSMIFVYKQKSHATVVPLNFLFFCVQDLVRESLLAFHLRRAVVAGSQRTPQCPIVPQCPTTFQMYQLTIICIHPICCHHGELSSSSCAPADSFNFDVCCSCFQQEATFSGAKS